MIRSLDCWSTSIHFTLQMTEPQTAVQFQAAVACSQLDVTALAVRSAAVWRDFRGRLLTSTSRITAMVPRDLTSASSLSRVGLSHCRSKLGSLQWFQAKIFVYANQLSGMLPPDAMPAKHFSYRIALDHVIGEIDTHVRRDCKGVEIFKC